MKLDDLQIFTKVVESGSFTRAAQLLKMPKSTVSRKVTELEADLGVRLLQRTTRNLKLTDIGENFYKQIAHLITEAEEAERSVRAHQEKPTGHLRITAPVEIAMFQLQPFLDTFLQSYPEITLELVVADKVVNLVEEGFDLAIRAGILEDSSLIAAKLMDMEFRLYASPDYLEQNGQPENPEQLPEYRCARFTPIPGDKHWRLKRGDEIVESVVHSRFEVNNVSILLDWTIKGNGIAMLPVDNAQALIAENALQPVLPDWIVGKYSIYMLYPTRRFLPAKVRVLIDAVREWFGAGENIRDLAI